MNSISCKNNFDQTVHLPKEKFSFRPSVYGVITDNGKVLLVKNRSNGKFWFPGGGVEIGEKLEEALKREIKEESNLEIEVKDFLLFKENLFTISLSTKLIMPSSFFFLCKPTSKFDGSYICDDLESEAPQWISISDVKEKNLSDLREDLFDMLQRLKGA